MIELRLKILTREAFAPYGQVMERDGHADHFPINAGSTQRFHKMAHMDVSDGGGTPILSVFHADQRKFPYEVDLVERHPLGSQAFIPLDQTHPWLVVVARGDVPTPESCEAFIARGTQGVQYAKNVWHHPLISLQHKSDFLVADRAGAGDNLEEVYFAQPRPVISKAALAQALAALSAFSNKEERRT